MFFEILETLLDSLLLKIEVLMLILTISLLRFPELQTCKKVVFVPAIEAIFTEFDFIYLN